MRRRGHTSGPDEWLDDDVLLRLIRDRLDTDAVFWTDQGNRRTLIVVEVDDGVVTLTGIVRSALERRRADLLARALGAIGVDNRLQLEQDLRNRSA